MTRTKQIRKTVNKDKTHTTMKYYIMIYDVVLCYIVQELPEISG